MQPIDNRKGGDPRGVRTSPSTKYGRLQGVKTESGMVIRDSLHGPRKLTCTRCGQIAAPIRRNKVAESKAQRKKQVEYYQCIACGTIIASKPM